MSININFVKEYLSNVRWNKNNNEWQVEGIIKKLSNQYLKFDISFLKNYPQDKNGKLINSKNNSDKILFENDKEWILIDTKEFIKYMSFNHIKEIKLEELIPNIEWNIFLPKKK